MQVVGVFVAGDMAALIALGRDFAVGVVAPGSGFATGQGDLAETVGSVPLILGDGAPLVLPGDGATLCIVAITPLRAVWQGFVEQLPKRAPGQCVLAAVRVVQAAELAFGSVFVMGEVAVRVGLAGDVALVVVLIFPTGKPALNFAHMAVEVAVERWFVSGRYQCRKLPGLVVLVFGDRAERVFFSDQTAFVIVGLLVLSAVRVDLPD